jgi:hypothetical protein
VIRILLAETEAPLNLLGRRQTYGGLARAQPTAQTISEIAAASIRDSAVAAIESDAMTLKSVGARGSRAGSISLARAALPNVVGPRKTPMFFSAMECLSMQYLPWRYDNT